MKLINIVIIICSVVLLALIGFYFYNNPPNIDDVASVSDTMFKGIIGTTIKTILQIVSFMLYFVLFGAGVVLLFIYIRKINQNSNLETIQMEIIRKGRSYVRSNRLRNLYTSTEDGKTIKEGRIIAFVPVEDKGVVWNIIAFRKSFISPILFIKSRPYEHSEVYQDIVLDGWNYSLGTDGKFLQMNSIYPKKGSSYTKDVGVDTIKEFSPIVSNSILANWYHRIKMRERNLLKLPESELDAKRYN